MKYSVSIVINLSREKVVELYDNPNNMKYWQEGFISCELQSGTARQEGAKSRLKYKMGKGEMEMMETIKKRDLPNSFSTTYEAKSVWNEVNDSFEALSDNSTRWLSQHEFRFSGFMKIIGFLMLGMFKKQSYKYLEDFKRFAEGQV
jgi:hypothetical protein